MEQFLHVAEDRQVVILGMPTSLDSHSELTEQGIRTYELDVPNQLRS